MTLQGLNPSVTVPPPHSRPCLFPSTILTYPSLRLVHSLLKSDLHSKLHSGFVEVPPPTSHSPHDVHLPCFTNFKGSVFLRFVQTLLPSSGLIETPISRSLLITLYRDLSIIFPSRTLRRILPILTIPI